MRPRLQFDKLRHIEDCQVSSDAVVQGSVCPEFKKHDGPFDVRVTEQLETFLEAHGIEGGAADLRPEQWSAVQETYAQAKRQANPSSGQITAPGNHRDRPYAVIVESLKGKKPRGKLVVRIDAADAPGAVSNACHAVMRLEGTSCSPLYSIDQRTGRIEPCDPRGRSFYDIRDFADPCAITFIGNPTIINHLRVPELNAKPPLPEEVLEPVKLDGREQPGIALR